MGASASHESLISMRGMGVKRSGRFLVEGINLDIRRGEIVTLIGPNGSGKSTTAKVATGVWKADKGTVTRLPKLTIGYVPQKLSIDWTLPLTVQRLMRLTGRYSNSDITDALNAVDAGHLRASVVQHLSGGEFQRVLLARAMVRKPDLLVLDEPVQGVDFSGEVALYDLIGKIRRTTNCGVLMISHDLHVVMAETDTVICLNGHMCCQGSPESVAKSPEYAQLFGERAAGKLAVYHHNHDHTHLSDGRVRHADGCITEAHENHDHHDHGHAGHHHA